MFQPFFKKPLSDDTLKSELKLSTHLSDTPQNLANSLHVFFEEAVHENMAIVILCIGSDRSTGDALGPITGTKLQSICYYPYIFGSLNSPVHATNLTETLNNISTTFKNPYILAIDASLGKLDNVGYLTLAKGALKPGAALNKQLPEVGNAHITGIVNVHGFLSEYLILQCTRLNLVVKMAETISAGLALSLSRLPTI